MGLFLDQFRAFEWSTKFTIGKAPMLTELRRRLVVALVVAAAFPARAVAATLLAVPEVREKFAKV